MNEKRYVRALKIAVISVGFGLLCCVSVFYLFWGRSSAAQLLPGILFIFSLAVSTVILLIRKRLKR